jgi:alpha-glucosidase
MMAGVRLLNSMGLTGVPYTGMDVGGFTGGPSKELFGRWVSIGAFSPFFRIHSAIDSKESDPWSYGEKIEAINKNYISLRYKLIPYLYSTFAEASRTGMPINRSLAINHTSNAMIYEGRFQNQYYFGPSLMICPVESNKEMTHIYLPDSDGWYSLYNDQFYQGGKDEMVDCPIERLPVFVKGGSVLTMQSLVNHTGEKPTDTLVVHVYNGKKAIPFTYYEDDGESYQYETGSFYKRTIVLDASKRQVTFGKTEGSLASKFRKAKVVFHGFSDMKLPGFTAEYYSFVSALPHFDPVGSGQAAPGCAVKSMVVDLSGDSFSVKY